MNYFRPLLILKFKVCIFILFNLICTSFSHAQYAPEAFVTKWQVPTPAAVNTAPKIFLNTEGAYYYKLYQVIGASQNLIEDMSAENSIILSLPDTGVYIVEIIPDINHLTPFHRFFMSDSSQQTNFLNLVELIQWGSAEWSSFKDMFYFTLNLNITAIDIPILDNVLDMSQAFFMSGITYIPNINGWNVSNVQNMEKLFYYAENFNEEIDLWEVSNVINMYNMFGGAKSFNRNINIWDVSNVQNMSHMFSSALVFNQDLSEWNTSNVNNMSRMFAHTQAFNQDIGKWNTSNVTDIQYMFANAQAFNQDISEWNTSNVLNMTATFKEAKMFNKDISSWSVSNVQSTHQMFQQAEAFSQNLGAWTLDNLELAGYMFNNSGMNCENYSLTLKGWSENTNTASNIELGAVNMKYSPEIEQERNHFINSLNWNIVGDAFKSIS